VCKSKSERRIAHAKVVIALCEDNAMGRENNEIKLSLLALRMVIPFFVQSRAVVPLARSVLASFHGQNT
jgi:hypothetical protein